MDEIFIEKYDPTWPARFALESARIVAALPVSLVLGIEHFGSTAIPGLSAKPVIDILVAVTSVTYAREIAITPMSELGYAFWSENPKSDRLFFVKGLPPAPRRTHHVHMTEASGEMWDRLLFRDCLRIEPAEAAHYSQLKNRLAASFGADREGYTAAKARYIEDVIKRARATLAG